MAKIRWDYKNFALAKIHLTFRKSPNPIEISNLVTNYL